MSLEPGAQPTPGKVCVFVDVQNIYYTTKQIHNAHFNYKAFFSAVTANRTLVKAIAYAIDSGNAQQRQFQAMLKNFGFEVKLKPYIQRKDGSAKGDWDVGITLDVIEYAPLSDIVVLASGDGDFDLLVHKVRKVYEVAVEVVAVAPLTAASLIQAATRFRPIEGDWLLPIKKPAAN